MEFQYTKTRTLPKLRLVLTHIVGQQHLPNLLHSNPIKRKDDSHSYGGHSRAICPENDGTDCVLEKREQDEEVPLANNLIHSRITCECFRIASPVSKEDVDELTVILFKFRMQFDPEITQ